MALPFPAFLVSTFRRFNMATKKTALTLALGSAIAATFTVTPASAAENPFAAQALQAGYMVAQAKTPEGKCGEGKCGGTKAKAKEGKCGEGKCGGAKAKAKEGKCGEGKCGGAKAKAKEGKCGEGKCGGMK
jgi:uncharacterized low-complexity protein